MHAAGTGPAGCDPAGTAVTVAATGRADRLGGLARSVRVGAAAVTGRVPPPAIVLIGILSVQFGATLAKQLFAVAGPAGAVALRVTFAAAIMLVVARPSLAIGRRGWPAVVAYGAVLGGMNICLYQAIARIPLGVAVTIEFLGPLTVALAGARRWRHGLWALLAAAGVALLTEGGHAGLNWLGVAFALCAATCWGLYILASAALGARTSGKDGLALGMGVAALIALPLGLTEGGAGTFTLPAVLTGLGVALLSSILPYTLELEALRRIPVRVFGVLMSLEPAVAALAGLVVLGEALDWWQWVAICAVVIASIGATRDR